MNEERDFNCNFRCFFEAENGMNYTNHYQPLPLSDIPKWISAYHFTHPSCTSISVKVWFNGERTEE